jgi:hypothetical protein
LSPNPILKVLSSMRAHRVRALLMGGQACVFYGGAEFSRDTDLAILADAANLARLRRALAELQAVPIAVPSLELRHLRRGHAVHFRCMHPDAPRPTRLARGSRSRGPWPAISPASSKRCVRRNSPSGKRTGNTGSRSSRNLGGFVDSGELKREPSPSEQGAARHASTALKSAATEASGLGCKLESG